MDYYSLFRRAAAAQGVAVDTVVRTKKKIMIGRVGDGRVIVEAR
jgi:hypothetical protein